MHEPKFILRIIVLVVERLRGRRRQSREFSGQWGGECRRRRHGLSSRWRRLSRRGRRRGGRWFLGSTVRLCGWHCGRGAGEEFMQRLPFRHACLPKQSVTGQEALLEQVLNVALLMDHLLAVFQQNINRAHYKKTRPTETRRIGPYDVPKTGSGHAERSLFRGA